MPANHVKRDAVPSSLEPDPELSNFGSPPRQSRGISYGLVRFRSGSHQPDEIASNGVQNLNYGNRWEPTFHRSNASVLQPPKCCRAENLWIDFGSTQIGAGNRPVKKMSTSGLEPPFALLPFKDS